MHKHKLARDWGSWEARLDFPPPLPSSGMASVVNVHVEHPPEASVTIHQVERVNDDPPGDADTFPLVRPALFSVLAQSSPRDPGGYSENSGFGYCFRQLHGGEVPLGHCERQRGGWKGVGAATLALRGSSISSQGDRGCARPSKADLGVVSSLPQPPSLEGTGMELKWGGWGGEALDEVHRAELQDCSSWGAECKGMAQQEEPWFSPWQQ